MIYNREVLRGLRFGIIHLVRRPVLSGLVCISAVFAQLSIMWFAGGMTTLFSDSFIFVNAMHVVTLGVATCVSFYTRDAIWGWLCAERMSEMIRILNIRLFSASAEYITNNSVGGMTKNVMYAARGVETLGDRIVYSVIPVVTLIVALTYEVCQFDYFVAATLFSALVISIGGYIWISIGSVAVLYEQANDVDGDVAAHISDVLLCHEVVRSYSRSVDEVCRAQSLQDIWRKLTVRAWHLGTLYGTFVQVCLLGTISILLIGDRHLHVSADTVGRFVAAWLMLRTILVDLGSDFREIVGASVRLATARRIVAECGDLRWHSDDITIPHTPPQTTTLCIKSVSFVYPGRKKQILSDVSLMTSLGTSVALVGVSGSGKSTLTKLIAGDYVTTAGVIAINDVDISKISRKDLAKFVSVIPQNPIMFNRTLMDNITYGNPAATDADVADVMCRAHVDVICEKLPNGLASYIGEGGVHLSGGERQRIAIARALLAKTPIIIMDEATSALDTISEKYIQDTIRSLVSDHIFIMIAHRLSTIWWADEIVVMQNGCVVERGSHEALLSNGGLYTKLHAAQCAL